MTPTQITLVQESLIKILPISDEIAEIFYSKLFELDPELKPLFKGNMKDQGRKLMAMLHAAVNSLNDMEVLLPALEQLGKRHIGYGVKDNDFETVGKALIDTIKNGLKDEFSPELETAWVMTYTKIADVMRNVAKQNAA